MTINRVNRFKLSIAFFGILILEILAVRPILYFMDYRADVKIEVSKVLKIDTALIPLDAHLMDSLGADQFDFLDIIDSVETNIGYVKFPEKCEQYNTVQKISHYIKANR